MELDVDKVHRISTSELDDDQLHRENYDKPEISD